MKILNFVFHVILTFVFMVAIYFVAKILYNPNEFFQTGRGYELVRFMDAMVLLGLCWFAGYLESYWRPLERWLEAKIKSAETRNITNVWDLL